MQFPQRFHAFLRELSLFQANLNKSHLNLKDCPSETAPTAVPAGRYRSSSSAVAGGQPGRRMLYDVSREMKSGLGLPPIYQ